MIAIDVIHVELAVMNRDKSAKLAFALKVLSVLSTKKWSCALPALSLSPLTRAPTRPRPLTALSAQSLLQLTHFVLLD